MAAGSGSGAPFAVTTRRDGRYGWIMVRLSIAGRTVADMEVWLGRALETLDTGADGSIGLAYLRSFSEVRFETGSALLTFRF